MLKQIKIKQITLKPINKKTMQILIKPIELKATLSQIYFNKKIITVNWEQIQWCEDHPEDFASTFFPIEITEKRLIEMGFVLSEIGIYQLLGFAIKRGIYNEIETPNSFVRTKIKYIHHIQDIIHAYTGQIIKLPKDAKYRS